MSKRTRSQRAKGGKPGPKPAPTVPADDVGAEEAAPPIAVKPPKPAPLPKAKLASPVRGAGFWSGFEIPWAKLVVFRFVFFGLLAVDAYLQIPSATRYGVGGFNVQHLPGAPLPDPSRPLMTFIHAALCIGFALIAQGALTRVLLPIATVLYGYAYFVSQLDSYQHHYLVWLLLVLLCFVPRRPDPAPASASPGAVRYVSSWALRLLLVQLAIVYFYAAVSKMDPLWLDGTTLSKQVAKGTFRDILEGVGWYPAAIGIIAAELFLAASLWWKKLWLPALAVGVGLHLGIELVGLEIGLFSYLMFAMYLLVIPDRAYLEVARLGRAIAARWQQVSLVARLAIAGALAAAGLAALIMSSTLVSGVIIAALLVGLLAAAVGTLAWGERERLVGRFAVVGIAALVPLVAEVATDASAAYYRRWAGASRRMGDDSSARKAYQLLLDSEPGSTDVEYAHFYLGELELQAGKLDEALRHYRAAQRSRPERARSFRGEALVHLQQGNKDAARASLDTALRLEPSDPQGRALLQTLTTDVPAEAIGAPPTDDGDR